MKSSFLHKTLLAVTLSVSLFSFVFINTRTGLAASAPESSAPLVEQALQPADESEERELRLPDVAFLGCLLKLAGKFLPVAGL